MEPLEHPADAARAVILPLDCPASALHRLYDGEPDSVLNEPDTLDEYITAAFSHVGIEPTEPVGIRKNTDIAMLAGLTAVRAHHADPLTGTRYDGREPPNSAETRMLETPLRKHPGLTRFSQWARQYYIATTIWFFEECCPAELQSEMLAILLGIDTPDVEEQPYRAYEAMSPGTANQRYRDRVEVTEEGAKIATGDVSQWCQLRPIAEKWIPFAPEELQHLPIANGTVTIPWSVIRRKLAEYAWHGWARLANFAYNRFTAPDRRRLVEASPQASDRLYEVFRLNNTVYSPYYASESENPLREFASDDTTDKPLQLEDKRLITAVDAIRASKSLSFDCPLSVDKLYTSIQTYVPPPRRPSNAVRTRATLVKALRNATHSGVKIDDDTATGQLRCEIPRPKLTPLFPLSDESRDSAFWNAYLQIRSDRAHRSPTPWKVEKYGQRNYFYKPQVSEGSGAKSTSHYKDSREAAERAAANAQSVVAAVEAVEPRVPGSDIPELSDDELLFLTRIGLVMNRQIADVSLTKSMRPLRQRADGSTLAVDEDKLRRRGWLERHDEGRQLLFTVPRDKRDRLNIGNVSNDGYGETTTAEKSLHRKGIDQCALALAAKPDVEYVVRYCDLWRLRSTICEDALASADLFSSRADVIGFQGRTPRYVAEVETASNDASKSQRCIDKLSAFSEVEGVATLLVAPNSEHLWDIMRQLDHPDYLDFDGFPDSDRHTYGRSSWVRKLKHEGVIDRLLSDLHTYRSLRDADKDLTPDVCRQKVLGHV